MKYKALLEKHNWIKTIFWIVVTAIITLLIDKSCDRIMPNTPVVVKEVSDTVKIIHSYDFNTDKDSLTKTQLMAKLENIKLAQTYESKIAKRIKEKSDFNSIMLNAKFPNAKGYTSCDASAYFSFQMSSLQNDYIDFIITFINSNILDDIYCLSLKIFKVENENRTYVLDENYIIKNDLNQIRITNSLPKGLYEISIGFTLKKDQNAEYPHFYHISKIEKKM
jgi:hypothetical protein